MRYLFYLFYPCIALGKLAGSVALLLLPNFREILILEKRLNNNSMPLATYIWQSASQSALWGIHHRLLPIVNVLLCAFLVNSVTIFVTWPIEYATNELVLVAWFIWIVPIEALHAIYVIARPGQIGKTLEEYRRLDTAKRAVR